MSITSNGKYPEIAGEFSVHPLLNKKKDLKRIKLHNSDKVKSLYKLKGEELNEQTYLAVNYIIQEIEKIHGTENKDYLDITIKEASNQILKVLRKSPNVGEQSLYQKLKIIDLENRTYNLQKEALTDPLTKLGNRRLIDKKIESLINNCSRNFNEFSIIILDIDFFKKVNDNFGHDVGDLALIGISEILKKNLRVVDTIGRWGGEEFLVILDSTGHNTALVKAENLRKEIEENLIHYIIDEVGESEAFCPHIDGCKLEVNCKNSNMECVQSKITCSLGISTINKVDGEIESKNHLVKRADSALYIAKENGRNMIYSGKGLEIPKK